MTLAVAIAMGLIGFVVGYRIGFLRGLIQATAESLVRVARVIAERNANLEQREGKR